MILARDDPAEHDDDVAPAMSGERLFQRRNMREMPGRERGYADHMHAFRDRLPRHFLGRGEQGSDDHLEAEIAEGRANNLLSAVMSVLADFRNEDFGHTPFRFSERRCHLLRALDRLRLARTRTRIDPA